MDKEKTFTLTECEAIIAVSEAIASERVHPEAVDFSSRTLAHASGAHPHLLEGLLDWLGVFRLRGYRRSVEQLRAVIAEYLPAARLQHADHLERTTWSGCRSRASMSSTTQRCPHRTPLARSGSVIGSFRRNPRGDGLAVSETANPPMRMLQL